MKKTFCKIAMFTAVAMTFALVGCKDDEDFGNISQAEVDLDPTDVGQLTAESQVFPFNLKTDKDAEWTATVEWDEENSHQLAYVYPKEGTGPAKLKIVSLPNTTDQVREGTLKITFPNDPSKNISIPLTQQRAEIVNGEAQVNGDRARSIGFGYNAFYGYCELKCVQAPILKVQEMYDNDQLIYDFSEMSIVHREESGASADELARKLNASVHAAMDYNGFSASVDAAFSGGQKKTASNEFAWMDINVKSATATLNGPRKILLLEGMIDEAYEDINGVPRTVRGHERVAFPSDDEGFIDLINNYGTHLVVGGLLGGQIRTSVVANTSKIKMAYNASVALSAAYNNDFVDVNGKVKGQQAQAVSKCAKGFYFSAKARGGGLDDGTIKRLNAILDKMSKARQGTGTESDMVDESDTDVEIEVDNEEYEDAYAEWKEAFIPTGSSEEEHQAVLKNLVLVDFSTENDLIPLYELVDRQATKKRDGFDGQARYEAMKKFYEKRLLPNPSILKDYVKTGSYIEVPPAKVDPMNDLRNAKGNNSLIQDVYLENGNHVARICSEFIPALNSSKRVNILYPVVNGKPRYSQGVFCGDEAAYPAHINWGGTDDPTTPTITTMKGYPVGLRTVAYLRGNHFSLEPDTNFKEKDYLTTTAQPYQLEAGNDSYNTVKINDYIYTRDNWKGTTFNNGTSYRQGESDYHTEEWNWYYKVQSYSRFQKAYGGFAPQGWAVPYVGQFKKLLSMIEDIKGNKPDGSIGKSFIADGVYGFTAYDGGMFLVDKSERSKVSNQTVCNPDMIYFGCISDEDLHFWDDVVNDSKGKSTTDSRCPALVINPAAGSAAIGWWDSATNNHVTITKWNSNTWKNPSGKNPDKWLIENNEFQNTYNRGLYVYMPLILCQKVIK